MRMTLAHPDSMGLNGFSLVKNRRRRQCLDCGATVRRGMMMYQPAWTTRTRNRICVECARRFETEDYR